MSYIKSVNANQFVMKSYLVGMDGFEPTTTHIFNVVLYQLSYTPSVTPVGFEPT